MTKFFFAIEEAHGFFRVFEASASEKNLSSAKDHYEELGGEKSLGISLRHFQQIESGKYPPSDVLLAVLFSKTEAKERRNLVLAYFRSVLGQNPVASELQSYLEQHLSPAIETESKSLWESTKRLMTYSDAQLEYLTDDAEALRFHRKVMLLEEVSKKECGLPAVKLNKLQALDLITVSGDKICPSRTLYRIPHFDNSAPRTVAKASDYIFKHLDHYSAREGSPDQELSYAMQLVPKDAAERIVEQMKSFKRWVQSLAAPGVGEELSPLLFVGFVRSFDRREL